MAFEDYDEYEQGEQVRKWIRQNGIAIVVGVVLALVLIFGWRQWQERKADHKDQAASQFIVLQDAVQGGDKQTMTTALENLKKNYADTPYGAFAAAAVARYDVGKGDLKPAAANLQWAITHSDSESVFKSLYSLRQARVLLAQDEAQKALTTLSGIPAGEYAALTAELRGDASLKLGKPDAARTAYQEALAKLDEGAPQHNVVQMKLDNLTQPAAAPTASETQ